MNNSHFVIVKNKYNFPSPSFHHHYTKTIEAEHNGNLGKVLDVGCGRGIARNGRLAVETFEDADEVVGVDPSIEEAPPHVDRLVQSPLSEASLPEDYFDTATSFMVMEHIEEPESFFSHLSNSLRHKGVYIYTTTSPNSVFGISKRISSKLGIDEYLLSKIKSDLDYHHELGEELGSESEIKNRASSFKCEFAYSEHEKSLKGYFPGPFLPLWYALKLKRRLWRDPKSLAHMTVRCVLVE